MTEAEQKFMFMWEMLGPVAVVGWLDSTNIYWEESDIPRSSFAFQVNNPWTPRSVRQCLKQRDVLRTLNDQKPEVLDTLYEFVKEMEWTDVLIRWPR